MTALKIEQDEDRDLVTIEGIRYSRELFRSLGIAPVGAVLRIESREDGVLTVTRLPEHESR